MPEIILSDYFYGEESEGFVYFKIPRLLITDQKFKHVSTDAKLLYGMLLDRMGLSARNNWYDDYGRVYIYYTVDEICEDMCCGRDKAMKLLAELDKKKGIGLVERVKQGQGRPTKLYVKRFTTRTAPPSPAPPPPDIFLPGSEVGKNHPQTSEKSTSRRRKKPRQEVEKTDLNHTKRSQLDFNHPDPSIPPQSSPGAAVGMDRYEQREEVKANIDFENLQNAHPYDDVESLLELMVDVLCSTAPTTRIIGNADSFIYLGGNEQSTHKYVSELLGKETIETRTSSQSKGRNGSYSQNFQQAGRELLTPDEVRMLDNRLSIILIRGEAPVIDAKFDLERHPNIKYTGDSGAAPYVHKAPCLYDAGDLDFTFTSLDDIEIIE